MYTVGKLESPLSASGLNRHVRDQMLFNRATILCAISCSLFSYTSSAQEKSRDTLESDHMAAPEMEAGTLKSALPRYLINEPTLPPTESIPLHTDILTRPGQSDNEDPFQENSSPPLIPLTPSEPSDEGIEQNAEFIHPFEWVLYPARGDSIGDDTYNDAEDMKEELKGAKDLTDYRKSDQSNYCDKVIAIYAGSNTGKNYVDNYLKHCGVDTWSEFDLPQDQRQEIEKRIGVFVDRNNRVFCSGFLIENNQVITARHCNEAGLSSKKAHFRTLENPAVHLEILSLQDESCNQLHRSLEQATIQPCDYIVVEVNTQPVADFSRVQTLNRFDRLYFVGYSQFKHYKDIGGTPYDLVKDSSLIEQYVDEWNNGILVSRSPTCIAHELNLVSIQHPQDGEYKSTCIKHSCQTDGGMSGGVLFTRDDNGRLIFAGVHIGANVKPGFNNSWDEEFACNMSPSNQGAKATNLAIFNAEI